ncbi:MAG: GNAT family N-acetyltransferase [Pseudomonadales bacterium]
MSGNNEPFRDFDFARDLPAVKRIWQEVGWVDDAEGIAQLDHFFNCGRTRVATIAGEAECSVHTVPGTFNQRGRVLKLCAVTAVTTSRIARGHAFAKRLTAEQLLHARRNGAQMAALGMFDQGFYDLLGFGTGAYDNEFTFDPDLLQVNHRVPTPERFGVDDVERLCAAMKDRLPAHGGVALDPVPLLCAELGFHTHSFGLGYSGKDGKVSHFVWLNPEGERGPYRVLFMAYQSTDQLLELLGLLKSLADQVYSCILREPPELQLQSLLARPLRHQALTKNGKHQNHIRSLAWWQARILDLPAVVSTFDDLANTIAFNLVLDDPLDAFAQEEDEPLGGEYVVHLGADASAVRGRDPQLPQLKASINALTRLLIGVASAEQLALTDEFTAPPDLLATLSQALRMPKPVPGLDF